MSTIRERVAAPMRVPAETPSLLGALQEAMFDRRDLLAAGDALAKAVAVSHRHGSGGCTPANCAVIARWAEVTGPER